MSKKKRRRLLHPEQFMGPRPYKGQNPRAPSDPFSPSQDYSSPDATSPADPQDARKDPGTFGKMKGIRWFR